MTRALGGSSAQSSPVDVHIESIPAAATGTAGSIATALSVSGAAATALDQSPHAASLDRGDSDLAVSSSHLPAVPGGSIAIPMDSTISDPSKLRPAEIAFLIRGGDITHTLIVVTVDLIQRSIKSQESSFSDGLADYERNMWRIVSRSVKGWAMQKAHEKILAGAQNPVAAARRAVFLFNFVRNTLRGMIAEMIADPISLKKYFSPVGVFRIIADFTASGYKQAFQEELRKSLLHRGLLVPAATRNKIGGKFFVIGIIGVVATLVASFLFMPDGGVAFVAWLAALFAGFLGRTLLAIRRLIPFYEELAVVAEQIRRKSFRLQIVKFVLRSVSAVLWLGLFLAVTVSLGTGYGIIKLLDASAGINELCAITALAITQFAIADFIFNGVRLNIEECPTRLAKKQLEAMQKELEDVSPLDTFTKLLATPNYDPTFSKVLALYGVETLLILI